MKRLHNDRPAADAPAGRDAAARDGLAALFTVAALLGDAMDRGLAERGLTRARGEVMWTLYHRGAMTQRQLSEALRCSPRNVTGLVDALEEARLVERGAHPTDRRATLVRLTARGHAAVAGWTAEHDRFAAGLFADLDTAALERFVADLHAVVARLGHYL